MKEKTSNALQKIAKYLIFAGVIASFFFIGWRIVTKGEYERRELAQCEALAVSAAFAVCDALDSPALAAHVRENGATEFIIDHMKMPGHNVVAVTITPEAEGFAVHARAETNWNSRSPQKYEFTAVKCDGGVEYPKENAAAKTFLALNEYGDRATEKRLTFTFPHELNCPVPFDVIAIKTNGLHETPLTVLRPVR